MATKTPDKPLLLCSFCTFASTDPSAVQTSAECHVPACEGCRTFARDRKLAQILADGGIDLEGREYRIQEVPA